MDVKLPSFVFDGVIDVSHNNGIISWPAVAGAGIEAAFIKATQGDAFIDPLFSKNIAAAESAGILAAPYHFIDTSDPARQAKHFIDVTGLKAGELAMIDWETQATAAAVVAFGKALMAVTGRAPLTYYGYAKLSQANANLSGWPLLLPEYPSNRTGDYAALVTSAPRVPLGRPAARPYDFHQYTDKGRIPGISGDVDRSIWVGTVDALRAFIKGEKAADGVPANPTPNPPSISGPEGNNTTVAPPPSIPPALTMQKALVSAGMDIDADGIWGPESAQALAEYYHGR